MKKITTFLCMGIAMLFASCSTEDDNCEDSKDLIGDFSHFLVAETSKGDYISGVPKNVTIENVTHSPSISLSGGPCDHDLGTGFHPYFDDSLSSGEVYFANFHEGHCAGYEENSRFHTFFDPGTYNFSNGNEKGIYISLSFNFESEIYYTTVGVDQPGTSYIRITESEPDIEDYSGFYFNFGQLVTGEFRARFVNPVDPSDVLEVTNGRFKVRVESFSEGSLN